MSKEENINLYRHLRFLRNFRKQSLLEEFNLVLVITILNKFIELNKYMSNYTFLQKISTFGTRVAITDKKGKYTY